LLGKRLAKKETASYVIIFKCIKDVKWPHYRYCFPFSLFFLLFFISLHLHFFVFHYWWSFV
jgi:hypothetical protein